MSGWWEREVVFLSVSWCSAATPVGPAPAVGLVTKWVCIQKASLFRGVTTLPCGAFIRCITVLTYPLPPLESRSAILSPRLTCFLLLKLYYDYFTVEKLFELPSGLEFESSPAACSARPLHPLPSPRSALGGPWP